MGATMSAEEFAQQQQQQQNDSTAESILRTLSTMMDPNSAVKDMKADANLHIIYSNPSELPPTSAPSSSSSSHQPSTSNPNDVTLSLDTVPLNDADDDEIQPEIRPTQTTTQSSSSTKQTKTSDISDEPLDIFMTRVAPPGLVRAMSSDSSSSASSTASYSAPIRLSPEQSV